MRNLRRLASPRTNLLGYQAGVLAVVAVVTGLEHHKHIPLVTWVSAAAFVVTLIARAISTPVADPRNAKGETLTPGPPGT